MRAALLFLALFSAAHLSAAELIHNVLPCGKPGSAGGLAAGSDMTRYRVDTARFPEALCNDGTPAVFYFAPATRTEDRGKWILFLQGGGGCRDGQSCAERWCSAGTNFGMDKMTSSLTKPSIDADGFLDPTPENRFGSWNRVLIHYCSSDAWMGTLTSTAQATLRDESFAYAIHFKGSRIIDAVLDTLRNSTMRRRAAPWPDLDSATHVIVAGSSAGSGGVRGNADRVGARLRATNSGLTDYRAILDASYNPQPDGLDFSRSSYCAADPAACQYDSFYQHLWETTLRSFTGASGDESCLSWHSTIEPGTEWRCGDDSHVVMHHLSTPFFLRQDLQDSLLAGNFAEDGFGTRTDFGVRVEAELRSLPVPEEQRSATPGLFVPQCTDHEAFARSPAVFNVRVDGLSFYEAVWNWWSGTEPQQAIRAFTGTAGAAPECP